MFALSKDTACLVGQNPAIHVHLSPELSALRIIVEDIDNFLCGHGPQRLDRIYAGGFSEGGPDFFGGRKLVPIFSQVSIVRESAAAFTDGPLKQPFGQWGRDQR